MIQTILQAQPDPRERMTSDQQNIADSSFSPSDAEADADETDDLEEDSFAEEDEDPEEEAL